MAEGSTENLFQRLLPLSSALFVCLAILAADSVPNYIVWIAGGVAIILSLAWLFSEIGWAGKILKAWLVRERITKDQLSRLSVLLDDVNSYMSDSYTLSPFYIWHSLSNKHYKYNLKSYRHHEAVKCWIEDIKEKIERPEINNIFLIDSLSKAVSEMSKLAEQVEKDLEFVFLLEECSEQDKKDLRKQWDSSRLVFNHWINDWKVLFKEINKTVDAQCTEYFRPLKMVE